MKKKIATITLAGLMAGLVWLAGNGPDTGAPEHQVPMLVRAPDVAAEKIARKRGDAELRAQRRATIEGRDEYWRLRLGEVPAGYLSGLRKQAERMPAVGLDKDAGLSDWTWLGPGNIGGRCRAFVMDPNNPQTMVMGGVTGGIWRSTNGGNWWTPVNDFMANLSVSCMAMTPDRQYIFAGTGEGFPGGFVFAGEGVFRSSDMGQTWQQLPIPNATNFQYINRIAVHPTIDGRLYVVTWNGALYRSDDDGMTWSFDLNLGTRGYDVKITDQTANGTPWIVVGGNSDAFLSTDDGTTFTSLVNGPVTTPLPSNSGRIEFAFGTTAGNDPVLYASISRNNGELWRSTDDGDTWTARNTGGNIFLSTANQGFYDNVLWVEPGSTQRLIWGGVDLFASGNGGSTFYKISDWSRYHDGLSAHADQHLILPHPNYSSSVRTVFFGNDGGVQSSADPWTSGILAGWTNHANGMGITQFYKGAASADGSVVMGGAQDNSFLRYTGGSSESWFQQTTGDGAYVAVDPFDSSVIYASTQNLNLRRSRNGGSSYTRIGNNIPDTGLTNGVLFIAPFKVDKSLQNALIAGGKRIWRSLDQGNNFTSWRDSLSSGTRCSAIEQSEFNPSRYYLGYVDGTVSRNIGTSTTWSNIQAAGMPGAFVTDIAVNPIDDNDVIVAFSTFSGLALWRSFNAGASWSEISQGGSSPLPIGPVNTVTFHPQNPDWIYVGTDGGVFASEDDGQTWSRTTNAPISEGPANTQVTDLFWAGDRMYAATFGRGMYVTRPLVVVNVDIANAGMSGQDGSVANPYGSVNQAEQAAGHGTDRIIQGGVYNEVNGLQLRQRGLITGDNGTVIIK